MDPPRSLPPGACIKHVFIMVCLLGFTRCSETGPGCCSEIPQYPPGRSKCENTKPAPSGCYEIGRTFRYSCIDGFVRRAGTSNLIRCRTDGQWTACTLECIEDPLKPLQTTTLKSLQTTTLKALQTTTLKSLQTTTLKALQTTTLRTTTERTSTSSPTSLLTPTSAGSSSVSAETQPVSTMSPPHLTSGAPFETSALPHTSSNTPSSSPVSSSAPLTTKIFPSTSSLSPPTTTQRSRLLSKTSPALFNTPASFNNSSSTQQETQALVTKVIAPVAVGLGVVAVVGAILFLYRRKSRIGNTHREPRESLPEEHELL